jgi:membrane protein involved in colicin uptake
MTDSTPPKRSLAVIRAQATYEATQKAKERRDRYEATDEAKALKAEREKRRPSRAEYRREQRAAAKAKKNLEKGVDNT